MGADHAFGARYVVIRRFWHRSTDPHPLVEARGSEPERRAAAYLRLLPAAAGSIVCAHTIWRSSSTARHSASTLPSMAASSLELAPATGVSPWAASFNRL